MKLNLKHAKTKLGELTKHIPTPIAELREAIIEYINQGGNIGDPIFRLESQHHSLITLLSTIAVRRREEFNTENSILDVISLALRENYLRTGQKSNLSHRVKFGNRELRAADILIDYQTVSEASRTVIRNNQDSNSAFKTVLIALSKIEQRQEIELIKSKALAKALAKASDTQIRELETEFDPNNHFFKAGLEAAESLYKIFTSTSKTSQPADSLFNRLSANQARHFYLGITARLTTDPQKKHSSGIVKRIIDAVDFQYGKHLEEEKAIKRGLGARDLFLAETVADRYRRSEDGYYEKLRHANPVETKRLVLQKVRKPTTDEINLEKRSARRFIAVICNPNSDKESLERAIRNLSDINALFSYSGEGYPSTKLTLLKQDTLVTPLQIAIMLGRSDAVELILQDKRVAIGKKSSDERTALHFAAEMPLFHESNKLERRAIWNLLAKHIEKRYDQETVNKLLGGKNKAGLNCIQLFDHCNPDAKFGDFLETHTKISKTHSQLRKIENPKTSIKTLISIPQQPGTTRVR